MTSQGFHGFLASKSWVIPPYVQSAGLPICWPVPGPCATIFPTWPARTGAGKRIWPHQAGSKTVDPIARRCAMTEANFMTYYDFR